MFTLFCGFVLFGPFFLSFQPEGEITLVDRERFDVLIAEFLVRFLPPVEMTRFGLNFR